MKYACVVRLETRTCFLSRSVSTNEKTNSLYVTRQSLIGHEHIYRPGGSSWNSFKSKVFHETNMRPSIVDFESRQAKCQIQVFRSLQMFKAYHVQVLVHSQATADVRWTSEKQQNIQCQVWTSIVRPLHVHVGMYICGRRWTYKNGCTKDTHFRMSERHPLVDVPNSC